MVQKKSARSRRTLRLSITRVSPPVPGNTASNGTSGRDTADRAVIHQDNVIGRERKLVAAAGRGAVDDANRAQAGGRARLLDGIARLVGKLAEIDLVHMACAGEHADVGTGTKDPRLAGPQQHHPHLRVLEADALVGVGEFDVDAKVVGIELQLIAFEETALLVNVHRQGGDGAVDGELPVAIARGVGGEIDPPRSVGELLPGFAHALLR